MKRCCSSTTPPYNNNTTESLEESMALREALSIEVGCLKGDLHQVREDRDHQLSLVKDLTAEVLQYKECTGGVASKLIQLEATCTSQSDTIRTLQEELATAEKKLEESSLLAEEELSLLLADKGQVGCRDYTHSRHLCVENLFEKTPHENYCKGLIAVLLLCL